MTPANKELLREGSAQLGVPLSPRALPMFDAFLTELFRWNAKVNLTAITNEREAVIKHLLDSLAFAKGLETARPLRLLDIGAGAGLPGIPLKIACSALDVTLLDSVGKKVSFMNHACRTLGLSGIRAVHGRAEELGKRTEYHHYFDVVTLRAVTDVATAAELARPFLNEYGRVVLSRGVEEMTSFSASSMPGFCVSGRMDIVLPGSDIRRLILILTQEKT